MAVMVQREGFVFTLVSKDVMSKDEQRCTKTARRLREDDVSRPVDIGSAEKSPTDSEKEGDDSEDQLQTKFEQGIYLVVRETGFASFG